MKEIINCMRSPVLFFCSLVTLLVTTITLVSCQNKNQVIFLSGAGMKVPVLEIAKRFEKETGIKVQVHLEGSSILHDYVLKFKTGDIFLPGDKKNLTSLSQKDLVLEQSFLAWHVVSILVAPGLKDRIQGLEDLAEDGIRLAISNPRQASLGKIVMNRILSQHPQGSDILKNVVVYGSSSQDVLRIYQEGNIDAIIEWDVMAATPEGHDLKVVNIAPPFQVRDELLVGLLSTSKNPDLARRFYNYLTTTGKDIFLKHGYDITEPPAREAKKRAPQPAQSSGVTRNLVNSLT